MTGKRGLDRYVSGYRAGSVKNGRSLISSAITPAWSRFGLSLLLGRAWPMDCLSGRQTCHMSRTPSGEAEAAGA